jgi:hypothetical protein
MEFRNGLVRARNSGLVRNDRLFGSIASCERWGYGYYLLRWVMYT